MTDLDFRLDYTSWGRVVRAPHHVLKPRFVDTVPRLTDSEGSFLPVGMRRSYGDSVINSCNHLIDMTGVDRFHSFDEETGILHCDAGVTLDAVLRFSVPRGWFLATTPGTRFVTLGGALANDVHGKNHHRAGTFGCSVRSFGLIRSDGPPQRVERGGPLFEATLGGLGLTGIITDVEIELVRVESAYLNIERIAYGNIREFFALAHESGDRFEHTVSWIDCANGGDALGRGIFQRANWCRDGRLIPHGTKSGAVMPFDMPVRLLNGTTVRLFNTFYNALQKRGPRVQETHYAPFFYPLDSIRDWNRMYGGAGLYQYQCVIPSINAEDAIEALIRRIARSGAGSFLAVLKTFGERQSGGCLSFPFEGATLALDFANRKAETLSLMAQLDQIVEDAGGRLYPAKDGRMSAGMFQQGYPDWMRLRELKDPTITSDFWQRVSYC
ncbi:FAD-binding oxidoreductase [Asaia astilbis]|uniref:FAD-binding oxidoreductase n=1 Tax=Asaia astilbis TaxID=610244 RepID=UPI000472C045|nr:FAD-binding oxidoreductase [Asaia astilbis]